MPGSCRARAGSMRRRGLLQPWSASERASARGRETSERSAGGFSVVTSEELRPSTRYSSAAIATTATRQHMPVQAREMMGVTGPTCSLEVPHRWGADADRSALLRRSSSDGRAHPRSPRRDTPLRPPPLRALGGLRGRVPRRSRARARSLRGTGRLSVREMLARSRRLNEDGSPAAVQATQPEPA